MKQLRNTNGTFQEGVPSWNSGTVGIMQAWNKGTKGVCKATPGSFKKGNIKSPLSGMKKGTKKGPMPMAQRLKISQSISGRKHSFETKLKMRVSSRKGMEHYKWNPNRREVLSNKDRHWGLEYRRWRTDVFSRDGYKCKMATKDCGSYIEAHHILSWKEYPELRYKINNGITLCHAHHPKKRAEEKRLVPTFLELVPVSEVQN